MKSLFFFLLALIIAGCIYEPDEKGQPSPAPIRVAALLNSERNFIWINWAAGNPNDADGFIISRSNNGEWRKISIIRNPHAANFIDNVGEIDETNRKVSYMVSSYNTWGESEGIISNEISLR